jgi:hypothetical protein
MSVTLTVQTKISLRRKPASRRLNLEEYRYKDDVREMVPMSR